MGNTCCCCVAAREAVSKKKKRTVEPFTADAAATVPKGGVNLDLIYIHPRIIAMGFPATGIEAWYRNPYEQVKPLLDLRHGSGYMVYNLCAEAKHRYDPGSRFDGRVREYPFWDHKPCPLALIPDFVADATTFLDEDDAHVVAIHCKAGKGRTGLLGCCLMMAIEPRLRGDAAETVAEYGRVRTKDGKGLTHRSQIRYVEYWGRLQTEYGSRMPPGGGPAVRLRAVVLVGLVDASKADGVTVQYVDATSGEETDVTIERSSWHPATDVSASEETRAVRVPLGALTLGGSSAGITVKDDLRIELIASGKTIGALSVHTLFLERSYGVAYIDKLYKRPGDFPADARIELEFDGAGGDADAEKVCALGSPNAPDVIVE